VPYFDPCNSDVVASWPGWAVRAVEITLIGEAVDLLHEPRQRILVVLVAFVPGSARIPLDRPVTEGERARLCISVSGIVGGTARGGGAAEPRVLRSEYVFRL
jgi:hypothetical protein